MITLDIDGRVDMEVTDFIMNRVKKYADVAGLRGCVLCELIALDWLAVHHREAERFARAYHWLEAQGRIETWRKESFLE